MQLGYGDSSHTADGKYIIACFRADANLGWVADLRSFLNLAELKYAHYAPQERRWRVAGNTQLYRSIMRGLQEAELTIIDQERYTWRDYFRRRDAGAELGVDFNLRDIYTSAAHAMLRESPLGLPEQIGLTPAMQRLFRHSTHLSVSSGVEELPDHDLTDVHLRSGGKFKDAIILSARAHSLLSPPSSTNCAGWPRILTCARRLPSVWKVQVGSVGFSMSSTRRAYLS